MAETECDIMMSYHVSDSQFVQYLQKELVQAGFNTWCIDPHHMDNKAEKDKKGQMIINSKVFIVVLSEASVQDAGLKDEMSLAYISGKPMYPLARKWYPKIAKAMESGMKLMLAKINWTFFVKEEMYRDSLQNLVSCVRVDVQNASLTSAEEGPSEEQNAGDVSEEEEDDVITRSETQRVAIQHAPMGIFGNNAANSSEQSSRDADEKEQDNICEHTNSHIKGDFWNRHFKDQAEVPFHEFNNAFMLDYKEAIQQEYDERRVSFFQSILHKDIFDSKSTITRLQYNRFVGKSTDENTDQFYEHLRRYASASMALREVLSMESTVRLATIQNLSQFRTRGVFTLLFDFVEDEDPNIRAVAALSLAKLCVKGVSDNKRRRSEDQLLCMLEDIDRVVRESACLSLAHMRCQRAVTHIVNLWRNDAIKHVREAAEIALTRIGGEEAAEAIKVTQILSSEMTHLRDAPS